MPMSLGPASCVKILLGECFTDFKIHITFLDFFWNPFLVQVHDIFGFRLTFVCMWGIKGLLVCVVGKQYWHSCSLGCRLFRIALAEQII